LCPATDGTKPRFPRPDRWIFPLNYRHDFHAGNFADLLKHVLLLELIGRMTAERAALTVLDTHAGAGLYDLEGEAALRSGEAAAGIARLMNDPQAPAVFGPLKAAVRAANPGRGVRFYPGSPVLALGALRPGDRYIGCELRPDDHVRLQRAVRDTRSQALALREDGYVVLGKPMFAQQRRLVLIDPPFERGDEYRRLLAALAGPLKRRGPDVFAIWLPLKDLETLDGFLRGLEALRPPATLVVQVRLRPLDDPTRMNGCALVVVGGPDLSATAREACGWIAAKLGDPGSQTRVELLGAA
jgi:23S rRNA (adenine2030-N6)-methyltransferase